MNDAMITIHLKYLLFFGAYTFSITLGFINHLIEDGKDNDKYAQMICEYFRRKS